MHNVNVDALRKTINRAQSDPSTAVQEVCFDARWHTDGGPQCTAAIPLPNGASVTFEADFPPPMGGTGAAPNPLAYCFWGGLACYAMTYAQEAALRGVELRALRAHARADVDMTRALGVTDNPPVQRLDWTLEVDADADAATLDAIKAIADEHCPGVYCLRNPIELHTELGA